MNTKNVPYKTEPGEGLKNDDIPGDTFPIEDKPISAWQKRILGIPVWGWVVIGCCVAFGGLLLGIALTAH